MHVITYSGNATIHRTYCISPEKYQPTVFSFPTSEDTKHHLWAAAGVESKEEYHNEQ
jgi:hypothetical protein